MDERRSNQENKPGTKSKTLVDAATLAATVAAAVASNHQRSSEMLKMDIDCCVEAFDNLSFKDLIAIGKTSKRLNQVVGKILHQYYLGVRIDCEAQSIYFIDWIMDGRLFAGIYGNATFSVH